VRRWLQRETNAALPSTRIKLSFTAPAAGGAAFEEYVSDPAKPVPFSGRPSHPVRFAENVHGSSGSSTTSAEFPASRCHLFVSDTLTAPMKISGQPIRQPIASTSRTDSDWVVKLIDLIPTK